VGRVSFSQPSIVKPSRLGGNVRLSLGGGLDSVSDLKSNRKTVPAEPKPAEPEPISLV
jgi:hypothetical protein